MSAEQSVSWSPARTWLAAGLTAAVLGLAVAAGILATSVASGPLIFVETLSARISGVLLSLGAGLAGVGAATVWQLVHFHTMNFQTFSEISFKFQFTPGVAVSGLMFALVMGFAGGLLPAVRAARLAIVQATRGG